MSKNNPVKMIRKKPVIEKSIDSKAQMYKAIRVKNDNDK